MRGAIALSWPDFDRAAVLRGIAAGTAWGLALSAGLTGLSLYRCGGVSLSGMVETISFSLLAGLVAIGPLAAFRRAG